MNKIGFRCHKKMTLLLVLRKGKHISIWGYTLPSPVLMRKGKLIIWCATFATSSIPTRVARPLKLIHGCEQIYPPQKPYLVHAARLGQCNLCAMPSENWIETINKCINAVAVLYRAQRIWPQPKPKTKINAQLHVRYISAEHKATLGRTPYLQHHNHNNNNK